MGIEPHIDVDNAELRNAADRKPPLHFATVIPSAEVQGQPYAACRSKRGGYASNSGYDVGGAGVHLTAASGVRGAESRTRPARSLFGITAILAETRIAAGKADRALVGYFGNFGIMAEGWDAQYSVISAVRLGADLG